MLRALRERLGLARSGPARTAPVDAVGAVPGAMTLALLSALVLTGIGLVFHYVPSWAHAFDSVRAIEQDLRHGRLLRSLHHWAAVLVVAAALAVLVRTFAAGAYKRPRELTWCTGVLLLLLLVGFAVTGELLRLDEQAYHATKIRTEILGTAPLAGGKLREAVLGGEAIAGPTLTRFHVLHVAVLPAALLVLLGAHLWLVRRHGLTSRRSRVGEAPERVESLDRHRLRQAVAAVAVLAALTWIAHEHPPDLGVLAVPSQAYEATPEWYMLWLNQLLRYCSGPWQVVGAVVVPGLVVAALLGLPFLDRGRERDWRQRPRALLAATVLGLPIVALTVLGAAQERRVEPRLPHPLGLSDVERHGYVLVRQHRCLECHEVTVEVGGALRTFGEEQDDSPPLHEIAFFYDGLGGIADYLRAPDTDDMPAFDQLAELDRLAIAAYLWAIRRE